MICAMARPLALVLGLLAAMLAAYGAWLLLTLGGEFAPRGTVGLAALAAAAALGFVSLRAAGVPRRAAEPPRR
jgi:hypothetical protein